MSDMLEGYVLTRRQLRALRTLNSDKAEREIIGAMISDCNYTIEWLRTGRRPGNRRGIERRAAYQRARAMDPIRLQSFFSNSTAGSPSNISDSERFQIEEALRTLTTLERECFEMAYGGCQSHAQIALMLGLSKGNVSTILGRANKKIEKNMSGNIFFL
ncbi:sigma factor-like helix-turn-helix DNA-binding protein [Paenibacillus vini]|uniref:sigma factor-like helix-turn-helix DNA-binding protein n=1 Tax=Paenibacillus vini TaxID=1476024 RepID=UPI0025B6CEC4|nr:sigma factor-like helix-turn-helix DNA-binding protein [Paenibacillus vini]MDN4069247.1 sigma factor-like helix-turn-helix DNA-binding protein [Paenibacillus vini]MDN4069300.1 sigma factor-like helix-turn-helix DNA-binding protein [Paenibacillus vini]